MNHSRRIAVACSCLVGLAAPAAAIDTPYNAGDRYFDSRWNANNHGFAAGVSTPPTRAPGIPKASQTIEVSDQIETPRQPEEPPSTGPSTKSPDPVTGQWVLGYGSFFNNSAGYAVLIQTVTCQGGYCGDKPATRRGMAYSDGFYCQTSDGRGSVAGWPPGGFKGFYTFPQCWNEF